MSELVRKKLVQIGHTYEAPERSFQVDRDRAVRWVSKFRALKAEGYRTPCPWSHVLNAIPKREVVGDDAYARAMKEREFREARYNASYVEDLAIVRDRAGNEFVECTMKAPPGFVLEKETGDLINPTDHTRIGEVSGAWLDSWRDGKGRVHRDILGHVALCTLPVWGSQPGFSPHDETTLSTQANAVWAFTMSSKGILTMATMPKKKKEGEEELPAIEEEEDTYAPPDEEEMSEEDETPLEEPVENVETTVEAPEEITEPVPMTAPGGMDQAKECVALLGEMGLALPSDTTAENFINHLRIVLTALKNAGAKFQSGAPVDEEPPPPPASAISGEGGDAPTAEAPPAMMMGTDKSEAVTISPEGWKALPAADQNAVRAVFEQASKVGATTVASGITTLSTIKDPIQRKSLERDQKRMRAEVREICDKLKRLGMPVYRCDELAADANMITLSLKANGDILLPRKLDKLRFLLSNLETYRGVRKAEKAKKPASTTTLSTGAQPEANPAAQAREQHETASEEVVNTAANWMLRGALNAKANGAAKKPGNN